MIKGSQVTHIWDGLMAFEVAIVHLLLCFEYIRGVQGSLPGTLEFRPQCPYAPQRCYGPFSVEMHVQEFSNGLLSIFKIMLIAPFRRQTYGIRLTFCSICEHMPCQVKFKCCPIDIYSSPIECKYMIDTLKFPHKLCIYFFRV